MKFKTILKEVIQRPLLIDLLNYKTETYQTIDKSNLDHQDLRKFLCNVNVATRSIYRVGAGYGSVFVIMMGAKYNPDYIFEYFLATMGAVTLTFTIDELVLKHFANPYQDFNNIKDDNQ